MTERNQSREGYAWGRPVALWLGISSALIWALSFWGGAPYGWLIAILWSGLTFAAILGLSDSASRAYMAASLEKPGISRGYAISTRQRLAGLWTRYATSADGSKSLRVSFRAALTWRLYDVAMLVAVVYPTLVLVGIWIVTGDDARLGDAEILPVAQFWPDRAISLIGMLVLAASIPVSWQALASENPRTRHLGRWLPVFGATIATAGVLSAFNALAAGAGLALGFLGGAAIAGAGSIVVVGAAAIVGAAAVAIATASTMMGVGLMPIGISIALVVTMAVALDTLDGQGRQKIARWLVTVALPAGWLAALLLIPWDVGVRARGLFLFLAVFPLLNAICSVVSYAANLALARTGLLTGRIVLYGFLGLGVGLVMSAVLGLLCAITVSALDTVSGGSVFSLSAIFASILLHPEKQVWLLLTILTPIAPAVLHAAIAMIGATMFVPRRLRSGIAAMVRSSGRPEGRGGFTATVTPFALGTVWMIPFVAIGLAGTAFGLLAGKALTNALWVYVIAIRDLAFALTVN